MRSLEKFSVGLLVIFSLAASCFWVQTAYAANLKPNAPCQNNWHYNWIGNVEIATGAFSWCTNNIGTSVSYAPTDVANCDSNYHNAESDAWQARLLNSSGTRYGETGRSGFVTYPPNCSWYWIQTSYLSNYPAFQLPDPSYGCGWFAVDSTASGHTLDYQCALMPNR